MSRTRSLLASDLDGTLIPLERDAPRLREVAELVAAIEAAEDLRLAYVTGRHFAQSPDLYGPIEMLNPDLNRVIEEFGKAAADLAKILAAGDQEAFDQVFSDVRAFFGEFTDEALEQSGFLIDRLVELSAGRSST